MVVRGGKGDHLKSKLHPTICDAFLTNNFDISESIG